MWRAPAARRSGARQRPFHRRGGSRRPGNSQQAGGQRRENGVADLANYRAKARWTDPSIPDEEIEGVRFEWDKERKEFVKAD